MGTLFSMAFDPKPLTAFTSQLRASVAPAVIARALNRTIDSEKVALSRDVAKDMGLKVTVVKNAMRVQHATGNQQAARVIATGARIPLINFGATGPEPSRGKGRGVSYRLQGGRGRVTTAFIATMHSGHRGVFSRKAKARLPIRELFGPSITHVFEKLVPTGEARRTDTLLKNLQHEVEFALTKA